MDFKPGDICSFVDSQGYYGVLKILQIVRGERNELIYNVAVYQELFEDKPNEDDLVELHLYIGHFPILEKYFLSSEPSLVLRKDVATKELGGFREWYKLWQKGKAGIFKLPISECISFISQPLREGERIGH